jgi:hypothetical protein
MASLTIVALLNPQGLTPTELTRNNSKTPIKPKLILLLVGFIPALCIAALTMIPEVKVPPPLVANPTAVTASTEAPQAQPSPMRKPLIQ